MFNNMKYCWKVKDVGELCENELLIAKDIGR